MSCAIQRSNRNTYPVSFKWTTWQWCSTRLHVLTLVALPSSISGITDALVRLQFVHTLSVHTWVWCAFIEEILKLHNTSQLLFDCCKFVIVCNCLLFFLVGLYIVLINRFYCVGTASTDRALLLRIWSNQVNPWCSPPRQDRKDKR